LKNRQSTQQTIANLQSRVGKIRPLECLDVSLVIDFLNQLEKVRENSARTRNARLAAIKAFFHFLEYRMPPALDQARRIYAIPIKKVDERLVGFLTQREMKTLLDSPDPKIL
jgi:site-specific recombinase XerD